MGIETLSVQDIGRIVRVRQRQCQGEGEGFGTGAYFFVREDVRPLG